MNPLILYDGYCNLCNATVNFIIRNDKKNRFRFAPSQSEKGRTLLSESAFSAKQVDTTNVDSVVLIYQNKVFIESDAGLKIAELLGFPWKILVIFKIIPRKLRDGIYRWIARNRYKWFGKSNVCRLMDEKQGIQTTDTIL